jgi:polyisoprenoid-binding protein YceI
MPLTPTLRRLAAPWLLAIAAAAVAQPVQLAGSQVSAIFTQMGVPVEAPFKRFSGSVNYDPAAPEQASAELLVEVASFDLGDPQYNAEVLKPDWFDAARYPQARFASSAVRAVGDGKLEIEGQLTIKGHTENVRFVATVTPEGSGHLFSGELPIRRLAHRVGDGEWNDTSLVADEVRIRFRLLTAP